MKQNVTLDIKSNRNVKAKLIEYRKKENNIITGVIVDIDSKNPQKIYEKRSLLLS